MCQQTKEFYAFGSFYLDTLKRKLWRNGEEVSLSPKVYNLLLVFVENTGKVLEKNVLMDKVWPDSIVEEANLSVQISVLRKVLGDNPKDQRYIETVPRRGYRFVAVVKKQYENREDKTTPGENIEKNVNRFRAYQLYLKGRQLMDSRSEHGLQQGLKAFQDAIELVPNYALAWAGLADGWVLLGNYSVEQPQQVYEKAEMAAVKSLELDEKLAEGHAAFAGVSLVYHRDWHAAERSLRHAIELAPEFSVAHHRLGLVLSFVGRSGEAMTAMKIAQRIDPLSKIISADICWLLHSERRFEEAMEQLQLLIRLHPDFSKAYFYLCRVYLAKKMFVEAIAVMEKARLLDNNPWILAPLSYAYAKLGDHTEAKKIHKKLKNIAKNKYIAPYFFAEIYIGLGNLNKAFEYLEQAYQQFNVQLQWMKIEPLFDDLRSDPRLPDLLRRMGL